MSSPADQVVKAREVKEEEEEVEEVAKVLFLLISPPMLIYKSSGQSTLSIPSLCLDHRGLNNAHEHNNHSCHRLPFEEESELQGGRWDFPQPERLSLMLIGAN